MTLFNKHAHRTAELASTERSSSTGGLILITHCVKTVIPAATNVSVLLIKTALLALTGIT